MTVSSLSSTFLQALARVLGLHVDPRATPRVPRRPADGVPATLSVAAGQCLDLRLPAGTLVVAIDAAARLVPPCVALGGTGWQPPPIPVAEGQAFVVRDAGRWRLEARRSGRVQLQRPASAWRRLAAAVG